MTTFPAVQEIFSQQKAFAPSLTVTSAHERIAKLQQLAHYIEVHSDEIAGAIHADHRALPEALLTEILNVKLELSYTCKNLQKWMKRHPVSNPTALTGTRSYYYPEPKGTVLIISPWNYPFALLVKPLISAIAAGNTVICKPSELTPATSAAISRMITALFEPHEVAVFEGDKAVAESLLALPFDHIYFTGSTAVGKIVMKAAAEHLSSVTLELGGKCPVIVDESADLAETAEKIAWGKWFNCGQTCVAADYVFVPEALKDQLISGIRHAAQKMFGNDAATTPDYGKIINIHHLQRLKSYLDDALLQGAVLEFGGETSEANRYFAPTLLTATTASMKIMQEEIFGPLLPVLTYTDKQQVIDYIRHHDKPLSLYIHSRNRQHTDFFLQNTTAGTGMVNDHIIHFGHTRLPIGGVNQSGIGKSGGKFGFDEFSNLRGISEQQWNLGKLYYPPYTDKVMKAIRLLLRFAGLRD